jgi:hypothetical protein
LNLQQQLQLLQPQQQPQKKQQMRSSTTTRNTTTIISTTNHPTYCNNGNNNASYDTSTVDDIVANDIRLNREVDEAILLIDRPAEGFHSVASFNNNHKNSRYWGSTVCSLEYALVGELLLKISQLDYSKKIDMIEKD